MTKQVEKTIAALQCNGFDVTYAATGEEAREAVSKLIPKSMTIGIGDSATLRELEIIEMLREEGRNVVNPSSELIMSLINSGECDKEQHRNICRLAMMCDVFLTGTNAVTQTGVLMNTDASGNRVAGMFFGPPRVVLVIGTNKIVEDVDAGYDRIRNCCAPWHAKTKLRNTPCTKAEQKCYNCASPERLCRVTSIIEKNPTKTQISIVLTDMDLGLGWDPFWPEERIRGIYDRYAAVTKIRRPSWLS